MLGVDDEGSRADRREHEDDPAFRANALHENGRDGEQRQTCPADGRQ